MTTLLQPMPLISSEFVQEWFKLVTKNKRIVFPDKEVEGAVAEDLQLVANPPVPNQFRISYYEFGRQFTGDLPYNIGGTPIAARLRSYCPGDRRKLPEGFGEAQRYVDLIVPLLHKHPALQGMYKDEYLADIAITGFTSLMKWVAHGDFNLKLFANSLLRTYRVGIPLLLREKSVLIVRW